MKSFTFVCSSFLLAAATLASPAIADPKPDSISVATWNLEWFYDADQGDNFSDLARQLSAPSQEEWEWRLNAVSDAIAKMSPTILALQEVENRRVLFELRANLRERHQLDYKIAFIEGFDPFTEQDVAVMFRSGLVEFSMKQQSQEMWDSDLYRNLPKHLFARFEWGRGAGRETLIIANVHLKATAESGEQRSKQARLLRDWLLAEQADGINLLALGDFNSETDAALPTAGSELYVMRGLDTADTQDDFSDLNTQLAADAQATHVSGKQFDHLLANHLLLEDAPDRSDLVFRKIENRKDLVVRGKVDTDHRDGYYKIAQHERDLSDHYPIIATFDFK
jgi:endonuclease/exonuclease/phosphatase family metal-dependent hydrolase